MNDDRRYFRLFMTLFMFQPASMRAGRTTMYCARCWRLLIWYLSNTLLQLLTMTSTLLHRCRWKVFAKQLIYKLRLLCTFAWTTATTMNLYWIFWFNLKEMEQYEIPYRNSITISWNRRLKFKDNVTGAKPYTKQ